MGGMFIDIWVIEYFGFVNNLVFLNVCDIVNGWDFDGVGLLSLVRVFL